jgi:DNA-binding NtrC family response regulator
VLAERFARERRGPSRPGPALAEGVLEALARYPWPGNVSELRAVIAEASALSDGATVHVHHLPEHVRAAHDPGHDAKARSRGVLRDQLGELERRNIEAALAASNGNKTRAAMKLGISRRSLLYKLAKFKMT